MDDTITIQTRNGPQQTVVLYQAGALVVTETAYANSTEARDYTVSHAHTGYMLVGAIDRLEWAIDLIQRLNRASIDWEAVTTPEQWRALARGQKQKIKAIIRRWDEEGV